MQWVNKHDFHRYTEFIRSGGQHFSPCCGTGKFLLIFSSSYYYYHHGDTFFRFLYRLLNLPRFDVWRNTSRASGRRLSFKQEKNYPLFRLTSELQWYKHVKISKSLSFVQSFVRIGVHYFSKQGIHFKTTRPVSELVFKPITFLLSLISFTKIRKCTDVKFSISSTVFKSVYISQPCGS